MERGEQSVNYEQAVAYIHGKYGKGVKRGLDNMYALLRRLGNPHEGLRCIHVAGTNGKGSTCAFLDAALRAQGYRVGLYTSPFLMRYNERMRINGCEIPDETLAALTTEVAAHVQAMEESGEGFPTVFEIGTAIVLTWLAREKVDVAVIEVGLGGTHDPTNVIHPEVSVIARIGLDHTRTLGSTLEEIAAVKGGILQPGRPAVLQAQGEAVAAVIRGIAQEKQAPFLHCADWPPSAVALSARGARFTAGFPGLPAQEYEIRLPGAHQVDNAVTALAALSLLPEDLRVSPEAARAGLRDAVWPGRLEWRGNLLLDGAHNPQGVRALREYAQDFLRDRRVAVLTGSMADKDVAAIAEGIAAIADAVVCVSPEHMARAVPAPELCGLYRGRTDKPVLAAEDTAQGLRQAQTLAGEAGVVLVCGSLYLVGEVRRMLESPEWDSQEVETECTFCSCP